MPKNKKASKKVKKRIARNVPRGLTPYQQLLDDPCTANLFSPYGGEKGFVQRFVQDLTVNTPAGSTAGFITICPSTNNVLTVNVATSNTAQLPTITAGPGASYLAANASKIRAISCCIQVIPAAVSYNSLTGEIGAFVTAQSTLSLGLTANTYSPDGVLQLCPVRSVLAKKQYEAKWFPGSLEHAYSGALQANAGQFGADESDVNIVGMVWRGYPAATALNVRITTVVEWVPRSNLGIAVTSAPGAPQNSLGEAFQLHTMAPNWWHNLLGDLGDDAMKAARYVGRKAIAYGAGALERGLIRSATNAMPMLLA
jgi:hypothetical protein